MDIRRGPFPVASGDRSGGVRVAVEGLATRAGLGRVVPRVVPSGPGAEDPGDVAACAVVAALVVHLPEVLACGVAEVVPEVLPVPGVARSCAAVDRGGLEVDHRAAGEEDLASACGHPVHPEAAPEDRADGVVPDRVPYGVGLAVARAAEAGTDCAATEKGRDSAMVAPSDSEPAAAASDC